MSELMNLLGDYAMLSQSQYRQSRYAGYSKEDLRGATHSWYADNRSNLISNGKASAPAFPKQVEFCEKHIGPVPESMRYYRVLRKVISAYIVKYEDDERFNKAHAAYVKDNEDRPKRGKQKAESGKPTLYAVPLAPMVEAPKTVIARAEEAPVSESESKQDVYTLAKELFGMTDEELSGVRDIR